MLNFFLNLFDKYGLDALEIGVITFFGCKIITNHLTHLKMKIDNICTKLDNHENKLNEVTERIAKLEGKLDRN